MENEWLDVAYINFDKAILHGQVIQGQQEVEVEQVLTKDEIRLIQDLNFKHQCEMKAVLRVLVK